MITRVRQLFLALTVLTAVGCTLLAYVALRETDSSGGPTYSALEIILFGLLIVGFIAVPLAVILTVLSAQIGKGRNWARVVAIGMLAIQALFCSCGGLVYSLSFLGTDFSQTTLRPGVGTVTMGVVWLAVGGVSVAAAVMLLLPKSHAHFARGRTKPHDTRRPGGVGVADRDLLPQ